MAKQFLLLMGVPGVGKTTLVRLALQALPQTAHRVGPLHYLRYPGGIELGQRRARFSGTDALPLNIQPVVLAWLQTACAYRAVLAEGDRLANTPFLAGLVEAGWEVTLGWLTCPPEALALRRGVRHARQSTAWLVSRATKLERLAAEWASCVWMLDGQQPVAALVAQFQHHAVVQTLSHGL